MSPQLSKFVDMRLGVAMDLAAQGNMTDGGHWLEQVNYVKSLIIEDATNYGELISLYLRYSLLQLSCLHQTMQDTNSKVNMPNWLPLPIIEQLAGALRETLIAKGIEQTPSLIVHLSLYGHDAVERLLILYLLATIGGPEAVTFISGLKAEDIRDAVATEDDLIQRLFPFSDVLINANSPKHMDKAEHLLKHLQALSIRMSNAQLT